MTDWKNTMMGALGINISTEEGHIVATMPVDNRTCQVSGVLHGGASLALAETLAGYGSMQMLAPGYFPYGVSVSGNHFRAVETGHTVHAVGTLLHSSKSLHTWNVDIFDDEERLISTVRVVNKIGMSHDVK